MSRVVICPACSQGLTFHDSCPMHASAPALLKALEKCAPSGCVYDDPRLGPKPAECHCAGCDARAAIRQAKGDKS